MKSRLFALLALALPIAHATAATVTFSTPALDKWLYANVSGEISGQADAAPVFGYLGTDDDDRLGSMLVAFNTSANIPTGRGILSYQVTSVRLTLAVLSSDTFTYDGTHDVVQTYQAGGTDTDAGRPLEVFGVGLRSPYTELHAPVGGSTSSQYHENSPFGNAQGQGYAYPLASNLSGQLFDATDNVSDGLEALPFAVGQAALSPGDSVPADTPFTFTIDLTSPAVLAYVRTGLNAGMLGFIASSLLTAQGQGGPQTYPRLYTREGAVFAPEFAPKLEVEYVIVPEPRTSGLLIVGVALFAAGRGLRHRHRLS